MAWNYSKILVWQRYSLKSEIYLSISLSTVYRQMMLMTLVNMDFVKIKKEMAILPIMMAMVLLAMIPMMRMMSMVRSTLLRRCQ